MFVNPFTPVFGGKPDFFFGRQELLARFKRALEVRGSEDRALFVTGTRGSGKTALVEQFLRQAEADGWNVFDVSGEHALFDLLHQLQPYDEITMTIDPSVEMKVFGSGGSVKGKSSARTSRVGIADFGSIFLKVCKEGRKGVCVAIDEIQKMQNKDVALICDAFQKASKKGLDAVLVVAGLPFAHKRIIQHDGCTYMRRAVHEELTLLYNDEVRNAFLAGFKRTKGVSLGSAELDALTSLSAGHPYIVQLLGYHLVEYVNGKKAGKKYEITSADIDTIAPVAFEAYERRALQPLLDALNDGQRSYLKAASAAVDDAHLASTGEIAKILDKASNKVTVYRESLLDEGIITAPEWGKVRFAIPYLRAYMQKQPKEAVRDALLSHWDI